MYCGDDVDLLQVQQRLCRVASMRWTVIPDGIDVADDEGADSPHSTAGMTNFFIHL